MNDFIDSLVPAPALSDLPPLTHNTGPSGRHIPVLTGAQKAAILVRLMMEEGADLPLSRLPDDVQTALAEQMGSLRLVDRDTMIAVVSEFVETLDQVGLSFPDGLDATLSALDGKLSPAARARLQARARQSPTADPWKLVLSLPSGELAPMMQRESPEVVAIVLSRLPVAAAAALLAALPGERARLAALALADTAKIPPDVVMRIGRALAAQIAARPEPAFPLPATSRVGAILNATSTELRDRMLDALDAEDAVFAEGVRKSILTFAHLHARMNPRDVPRLLREVPQNVMITALAAALAKPDTDDWRSADFLLANLSQRMASGLREEVEARGAVRPRDAEAAMSEVVTQLRALLDSGAFALLELEE